MRILLLLILLLFIKSVSAQEDFFTEQSKPINKKTKEKKITGNRLFFGGNFGIQAGDYTIIELSPLIGYRITEKLSSGIQINYSYIHISVLKISTHIYGGSLFSNYYINKNIFARCEYEWLSLESRYFHTAIYQTQKRFSVHSVLIGGGYRQQIGERSYINLMILWNLNENALSPYQNPIIRISFEL